MKITNMRMKLLLVLPLLFAAIWLLVEAGNEPANPCLTDDKACMKCHNEEQRHQIFTESRNIYRPCDTSCASCHKKMTAHHLTGMEVDLDISPQLLLTKDKRLACMTCHDLSVERYSATAKKAQSLFQRMFKAKKKYKSYYLVMDNRGGQLCKQCH